MIIDRGNSTALWSSVFAAFLFFGRPTSAAEFQCGSQKTTIVAADGSDVALACEGAAAAISFLKAQGLDVDTEINIEIVPTVTEDGTCEAAGYFYASEGKILVLNYTEFRKFEQWLRVPISDSIYKGLVAHEVAHLIAMHNFEVPKPTIQAQEYVAYVTTLATLEPDLRELIFLQFTGDGYETEQQMNTTVYLCNPMRFGVEAYRHFVKKGSKENYFNAILAGRALAD